MHLEGLGAAVEPDGGAERHRRHVLAVPDRHVRDRRDPERSDQLVEHLLDRERRLRLLGHGLGLQVDVGAEHEAGGVVELAGADQVVERRVDQVRLGVQVLDHRRRSRRSATSNGVPMLEDSSVRQPPTSGASAAPSPTVSTYGSSGSSNTRPERLRLERAVEPVLGLLGQRVLLARVKRRKFGP